MPKLNWTGGLGHTSDSEFRAWVSEVEANLAFSGLVKTSDTGQIDTNTVTRPGTNAMAGYSVWRFNDPLQSVAPVFLRLQYGTASNAAVPSMTVQMGDGSDGSGNLTGRVTAEFVTRPNGTTTPVNPQCFVVHNDWGAGLVLRVDPGSTSGSTCGFGWAVHRTVDATGQPTSEGVMLNTTNGAVTAMNQPGNVVFFQNVPSSLVFQTTGVDVGHCPMSLSNYVVGVSPQVFPVWCALPKVRPMAFLAVAPFHSAPGLGQTFQMAVVGSTPRTYISVQGGLCRHFAWGSGSEQGSSFLMWED